MAQDARKVFVTGGTGYTGGLLKAAEFLRVDLASALATVHAAKRVGAPHLVYLSVAQPAPIMRDYVNARAIANRAIADAKLTASVLRPWYVLGPEHRWPIVLVPIYAIASMVPSLREGAERMGLVTRAQMVKALVRPVETPPAFRTIRVVDVPGIRAA